MSVCGTAGTAFFAGAELGIVLVDRQDCCSTRRAYGSFADAVRAKISSLL